MISHKQRNTIYLLLKDISLEINGSDKQKDIDSLRDITDKAVRDLNKLDSLSLSNCSSEIANSYIAFLLDLAFEYHVDLRFKPDEDFKNIEQYTYVCIKHRACAVCGKPHADIHHLSGSRVGMGSNRLVVDQVGREVIPLCRLHHNQCHNDEVKFLERYHLKPLLLTKKLVTELNI